MVRIEFNERRNKMNKCYIILFKDGALQIYNKKQNIKTHMQTTSKQFVCADTLSIIEICEWQAKGYKSNLIKEI
jgi:hypothetical protein